MTNGNPCGLKVRVLFFSVLREKMKKSEDQYEIFEGETVSSFAERILGSVEYPLLFAINQEYVARDYPLEDGDEVALIPPVSGG